MASLKSCLAKVKKAGYDTSQLPLSELEISSDPIGVINSELTALRTEHGELFTTRERLMEQLRQFSPEMNEAIQEHIDEEVAINAPRPADPSVGPTQPTAGLREGIDATNAAGLPKQPQAQATRPLANLEQAVEEKKATVGEEETAKVSKTLGVLRRAQRDGKEYHELSTGYAVRKAVAAGKMKEIRDMFPEETSNVAAMKKFQQVAKNQVATEKKDDSPVFNKRQEKQLGAYNKKLAEQRSDEVAPRGEKETSDDSQLEGATEQEPKTIEVRIEPYTNKKGKRSELSGVVGIARRVKKLISGATLHRETAGGGLSTYVIKVDNAEQGAYDGTPQQLAAQLTKTFVDGRRDSKNKLFLYDSSGEAIPVNSREVTKLGAVVDQTTQDAGMAPVEKSGKQFNAGLAYLMVEGNLTLTKREPPAPPSPLDNKLAKAAWDRLHPFLKKVIGAPVYMSPGDIVAAIKNHGFTPLGLARQSTTQLMINKARFDKATDQRKEMVIYHEAGHLADGELGFKPQSEWVTAEMLAKYYKAGTNPKDPLHGVFHMIFREGSNYSETSWRKEVVAQLNAAYYLIPNKLKQHSPEGYALVERMNDELQLKSEFIERAEAERRESGRPGGRGSDGQATGAQVSQEKAKGSEGTLSNDTVIDSRGTTVGDAAAYISARKKKPADFDPRDVEEIAGEVEGEADARAFEPEEAQIARSTGAAKTSPELVGASIRPKQINPSNEEAKRIFDTTTQRKAFGKIPTAFIALTNRLFSQLGIKTKVLVVDKAGAETLLKETGLPTQWSDNLKQVINDQPIGRLMLSDSSNANERFAIVYIDTTKSPAKQQRALLHELGHIVQLAKLDQASPEIKKALRDAHEGTQTHLEFEEWFANQLLNWANSKKAPKSALDKFFKDLARVLRRVYNKLSGAHPTYEQFMDSLVAAEAAKRGLQAPASGKHRRDWIEDMRNSVDSPFLAPQERSFYNFNGDPAPSRDGVSNKGEKILEWGKEKASGTKEALGEIFKPAHQIVTQTSDAYLRSNGLAWLADHFHKRPDVRSERVGPTIEQEIRAEFGQFESDIDAVLRKMPKGSRVFNHVDRKDPKYAQAIDDLISQSDNPNALAQQTRDYFKKMEQYLTKNGVDLKKRKKYFPIMLDKHQWMANHDKVVKIAMEKLHKTREEAENMYLAVANDPSTFADMSAEYDPKTTATFGHSKSREFGPKEHQAFAEFIDTDIASVVKNYTHSAVKHVVVNRHFGALGTKAGQADPLVNLKTKMTKALIAGEITQEVYDRTWNTVIPGMFGQLGADMNPTLRKMQSGLVFFQNVRLLGTAVLSSLVDPVHVLYRSGTLRGQWSNLRKAMGELNDKEAQLFYRTLGIIRDDLTEAIVNDPTHTQFYAPKIRSLNETFFRLNGMHALTNLSRMFSFSAGRQYIMEMAKTNNTKRLAEMGLTRQEVLNWDKRGQPFALDNPVDANVLYALHQFVDESILRPSAAMRPAWMSDQRWLLVANLKSFIFTYHETILRRIWSQVRAGEIKDPAVLLPFVAFAAVAMGVSMFGYEARKQIMNAGDVPPYARADAMDYIWEGLQRTGALGTMQFLVDAMEAESRGKMALMSVLGPTASQFEMLMTKDLSYSIPRSLPIFAQSPSLREFVQ